MWGHSKKTATCKPGRFLVDTGCQHQACGTSQSRPRHASTSGSPYIFFQLKRQRLNLGKSYASMFQLTETWQCSQQLLKVTEQGGARLSASPTPSCLQDGHDGFGAPEVTLDHELPWEGKPQSRWRNRKNLGRWATYRSLGMTISGFHSRHHLSPCYLVAAVVQLLSRVQLFNPMDCSTPGFSVLHRLWDFVQTHVHCVGDAILPSHPLSPPSPALNLSQHQGLFQ